MRRIIANLLISLDGVVEEPGTGTSPLAPTAWPQWRLATPGTHRLQVRAEGRLRLQPTPGAAIPGRGDRPAHHQRAGRARL